MLPKIIFAFLLFIICSTPLFCQTTAKDFLDRANEKKKSADSRGAGADYSKAIELDPALAQAYFGRAGMRAQLGDNDGAISDNSKALEIDPSITLAYAARGGAYFAKGDTDAAISDA